jgi:TonB family protein
MKRSCALLAILVLGSLTYSQSGRRARETKPPEPATKEVSEPTPKPSPQSSSDEDLPQITAERNQDYRCTDDGSLARILETDPVTELVVSPKEADVRAEVTARPKPSYTKEARRNGVQGFVTLKILLSADAKISRVRLLKGLPFGLSANAIRAACKMEFKPAMKDGKPVAQWLTADYAFRLADSSIFAP